MALTWFADAGVPLPLVWAAAVGGARWWNTGVPHVTARFHSDRSGRTGQRGSVRPHTQANTLSAEAEVCVHTQQTLKGDCSTHQHILHAYASSQSPINADESNQTSPVCILGSRSEPLQIPVRLPHADVSPSDRGFHFPLSLFPSDRWRQMQAEIKTMSSSSIDTHYFNTEQIKAPAVFFNVHSTEGLFFWPMTKSVKRGWKWSKTWWRGRNNNQQFLFTCDGNVDS